MKAHRQKIGRWTREMLAVVDDPLFWDVMAMMSWSHEPYKLLMLFLQSTLGDDVLDQKGAHLQQLVGGKAKQFGQMFTQIYMESDWSELVRNHLDSPLAEHVPRILLGTFLCHAGGFNRRIVDPTKRCRCRVCGFGASLDMGWGSLQMRGLTGLRLCSAVLRPGIPCGCCCSALLPVTKCASIVKVPLPGMRRTLLLCIARGTAHLTRLRLLWFSCRWLVEALVLTSWRRLTRI